MTDALTLPEPPSGDGALEKYINYEQGVLQHAISVADAKATFVLTISLGLAVFYLPDVLGASAAAGSILARALAVITELTLLSSGAAAFFTVLPRVNSSETDSDIAWMSKGFLGPAAGFIERCKTEITLDRLQADQLNHLHILARICRAKYRDLRLALWLIPAGLAFLICGKLLPVLSAR
jgi:hypothetical protein